MKKTVQNKERDDNEKCSYNAYIDNTFYFYQIIKKREEKRGKNTKKGVSGYTSLLKLTNVKYFV